MITLITVRSLLVTSRKERVVEWVKEVVPRCNPRTILPSFLQSQDVGVMTLIRIDHFAKPLRISSYLYCSIGSKMRSRTPTKSCSRACIGPTPGQVFVKDARNGKQNLQEEPEAEKSGCQRARQWRPELPACPTPTLPA